MGKVAIITGSPSQTSRLNEIISYLHERLKEDQHEVSWINVRDLPAEDLIHAKFDSQQIASINKIITQADGVIVATPVYKASYTGVLKTYLDLLPQNALQDKTVLPLAIGGTLAHLLVIDYALKPVLSALGATTLLQGVFALDTQVHWNEDGLAQIEDGLLLRLNTALQMFTAALEGKEKFIGEKQVSNNLI